MFNLLVVREMHFETNKQTQKVGYCIIHFRVAKIVKPEEKKDAGASILGVMVQDDNEVAYLSWGFVISSVE